MSDTLWRGGGEVLKNLIVSSTSPTRFLGTLLDDNSVILNGSLRSP